MTITLNIDNEQLFNKILWFLNRFKNDGLEIITNHQENVSIKKQEKSKNRFSEFSGMWENRDISQELLREKAWK